MSGKSFYYIFGFMLVASAGSGVYLYSQQSAFSQWVKNSSSGQNQAVEQLKIEIKDLKDQLKIQQDIGEVQRGRLEEVQQESAQVKGLIPQIKDSIAEIKTVISQSRAEAWKIKDDTQAWQKDYVSTLVALQQKIDALDRSLNSTSELVDQGFPRVLQDMDAMKEDIQKINKKIMDKESAEKLLTPLPRFDPRLP